MRESWIVVTLLATSSFTVMAGTAVAPALPGIQLHFADTANVELLTRLVLTAPALAIALLAPVLGALSDRFGRRRMLLAGVLGGALSGSAGFLLDDLHAIIVSRVLFGVAVASTMTCSTALIGDYFRWDRRERVMGRQAAAMGLGAILFVSLGGLLADISWRSPFLVYGAAFALVPLVAALPAPSAGSAGRGAPAAPAFRWRGAFLLYAAAGASMLIYYVMPTHLPFHLREIGIAEARWAGLALGLVAVTSAVSSLFFVRIKGLLGAPTALAVSFAVLGAGLAVIALSGGYGTVLAGAALCGLGMGCVLPNIAVSLVAMAPEASRGRVLSGMTSFTFLGQFLSPIATQPVAGAAGLPASFAVAAAAALALALVIAFAARARALAFTYAE